MSEDEAYMENFARLSYSSSFVIMNLGTMQLIFMFYLALYMIYPITCMLSKCSPRAQRLRSTLNEMLFWNHAIVFLQEGFIEISLSVVISLSYIRRANPLYDHWGSSDLVFNNFTGITLVIASSILFCFLLFYLWPRHKRL